MDQNAIAANAVVNELRDTVAYYSGRCAQLRVNLDIAVAEIEALKAEIGELSKAEGASS